MIATVPHGARFEWLLRRWAPDAVRNALAIVARVCDPNPMELPNDLGYRSCDYFRVADQPPGTRKY